MSTYSPFPWTSKLEVYGVNAIQDADGIKIAAVFNRKTGDDRKSLMPGNTALILAAPELLRAAMRGHGWGDPLHQQHDPTCAMCAAIRQAIGPLTRERVLELARWEKEEVRKLVDRADGGEWDDVWIHLGIASEDCDPEIQRRLKEGEFEAIDVDILHIITQP